jgi:hypothetical protein
MMEAVHMDGVLAPPGVTDDDPITGCCYGEAVYGPTRCTCWEPVYDLEQQSLANGGRLPEGFEPETRTKCCRDCAYRQGSPERERGEGDQLDDWALDGRSEFWCHQGVRRVVAFRHPDGRELPAGEGDYRPPVGPDERPVVWKADGTVGERCAGWAALSKANTNGKEKC